MQVIVAVCSRCGAEETILIKDGIEPSKKFLCTGCQKKKSEKNVIIKKWDICEGSPKDFRRSPVKVFSGYKQRVETLLSKQFKKTTVKKGGKM